MAVVFAVLVGLIILIKILNMAVARPAGSKKPIAVVPAAAGPVGSAPVVAEPVAAAMPVFSGDPQDLKLIDVDEQTAAIIMAIVCDELDTPVNELYFKSIRLLVNQVPAQNKGV